MQIPGAALAESLADEHRGNLTVSRFSVEGLEGNGCSLFGIVLLVLAAQLGHHRQTIVLTCAGMQTKT